MVKIKEIEKSYGSHKVLKRINLEVKESEVVVIIGSSGSGKSTLLRCINFLEKPQKGSISIDGEEVNAKSKNFI
jgi:polar amino acid transport system ATP-binding protein